MILVDMAEIRVFFTFTLNRAAINQFKKNVVRKLAYDFRFFQSGSLAFLLVIFIVMNSDMVRVIVTIICFVNIGTLRLLYQGIEVIFAEWFICV